MRQGQTNKKDTTMNLAEKQDLINFIKAREDISDVNKRIAISAINRNDRLIIPSLKALKKASEDFGNK